MLIHIKPNDRYPWFKVKSIIAVAIARKGYGVYATGNKAYKVMDLRQDDQNVLKLLVIKLCEHYGFEYTIDDYSLLYIIHKNAMLILLALLFAITIINSIIKIQ